MKKIVLTTIIFIIIMFYTGCVENVEQNIENVETPSILSTKEETNYKEIRISTNNQRDIYDYHGNLLHTDAYSDSEVFPYEDDAWYNNPYQKDTFVKDWEETIIEENEKKPGVVRVEIVYVKSEKYGDDNLIVKNRYIIFAEENSENIGYYIVQGEINLIRY